MDQETLTFFPGTVVPMAQGPGWTFTVRDQFARSWNAFENFGATFCYAKATEAKAAMRIFCGVKLGD